MSSSIFDSCMCYARIQKILKTVKPDSETIVNEDNFAIIAGKLLLQSVKENTFDSFQKDYFEIATYLADKYNATKDASQGEKLEKLVKDIYSTVKDEDINMFFFGGLALNMHARANAQDPTKLVYRTSGDIDIKVDEERLTDFLAIMHKNFGLKGVEDRRVAPPKERHVANFESKGLPRSGPLVVMNMQNGLNIEIFPIRVEDDKTYEVGYYPKDGVTQAYTRLYNFNVHTSQEENDPPHPDVVSSFVIKCGIGRNTGKDFIDAYNLAASGCVQSQDLEKDGDFISRYPWHVSTQPNDDHSENASEEVLQHQEECMGFNFDDKLKDLSLDKAETEVDAQSDFSTQQ